MTDSSFALLVLLAVFLGAILTLAGAALGALVVFRTKREPHEPLFKTRQDTGDAFILDDLDDGIEERVVRGRDSKVDDPVPSIVAKQTEKFLNQLKNKKEAEG